MRLYRATGRRSYLELSQYFSDERGQEPYYFDQEGSERGRPRANDGYYRRHGLRGPELRLYNQSHAPVREQQQVSLDRVRLLRSAPIASRFEPACLSGVVTLEAPVGLAAVDDWRGDLYRANRPPRLEPPHTVAVPYARWDNRSAGQMRVWMHEDGPDGPP